MSKNIIGELARIIDVENSNTRLHVTANAKQISLIIEEDPDSDTLDLESDIDIYLTDIKRNNKIRDYNYMVVQHKHSLEITL